VTGSGRRQRGVEPGRLLATMLRALAAELSDPGRFSRAKAYARDGAVIELDVRQETVSGLVLGSRRDPYEVVLVADPAPADELAGADPGRPASMTMLIPGRDELAVSCTCPDGEGFGGLSYGLCKHALAVLLVLADETSGEPGLLTRWRTSSAAAGLQRTSPRREVRRLPRRGRTVSVPTARIDILAGLLDGPAPMPELPAVGHRSPVARPPVVDDPATRLVYELYAEAVAAMREG
jgi:SWIM zinc finger